MQNEFDAKVAVITGGGSLISLAVAAKLVKAGARVVLGDRQESLRGEVERVIGDCGSYLVGDLADDAYLDGLVAAALGEFGRVDFLLSAAVTYDEDLLDTTREKWHRALDVNLVAAALLTRKASLQMGNGGSIVYLSSISGRIAQHNRVVYSVTKAALLMLAKSAAQQLAPRRVRVNAVSPGWTWSRNMERRWRTRGDAEEFAAAFHPLGRMADPDDIADGVLFLMSDRAKFITGADLLIDGGYSAIGPEALGQAFDAP